MIRIPVGKRVYVESFDFKGYGTLMSNKVGYHVLLDGFVHTLYFDYPNVREVIDNSVYDVVIRNADYKYECDGAIEIGSILYTFNVSTDSTLYKYMLTRLRKPPYKVAILMCGE